MLYLLKETNSGSYASRIFSYIGKAVAFCLRMEVGTIHEGLIFFKGTAWSCKQELKGEHVREVL